MFIGEVGIDPRIGDGGRGYRRRVAGLIAAGRAWARFERGQVVFKAEVGSQSPAVGQIQGVWVHPDWRGRGLGTAGTATLAAAVVRSGRIASLYVNDFNTVARATYARIGFSRSRHLRDRPSRLTAGSTLHAMTDRRAEIERREIADALVRALERRHELLDAIVDSEDYDAAIEAIADDARHVARRWRSGAAVVLRPAHQGVAPQDRRRTRGPQQPN